MQAKTLNQMIVRSKSYHGKSFIDVTSKLVTLVASPTLVLSDICTPHFPFDGKSSIANVFGQQTKGFVAFPSHCDFLKKFRCLVDIDLVRRRFNGRH